MTTHSGDTPVQSSTRRVRPVTVLGAVVLAFVTVLGLAGAASAVTQASAESQFRAAGITWSSSGNCTTKSNSTCTSFDGIQQSTIDGAKTLKSASGCGLNITGGTEAGHAGGQYSHGTGYKLDFARTTCLDNWVTGTYTYTGLRSDGYPMYQAASGNVYTNEGSHWDVVYYTCGC